MTMLELDAVGMLDTAAEAAGKVFVSTELGGGGRATAASVAIAEAGIRRFLAHAGVLEGDGAPPPASVWLDMPDPSCFITCLHDGLLEMCVDLGEPVAEGQLVACVHDVTRTGAAPAEYRAVRAGLLATRHFPGLVGCGDTLAVIADTLPIAIEPPQGVLP